MLHSKSFSNVELIPAPIESKDVIKNMARFYVYELSKYNNHADSEFPEDGLHEAYDLYFHFDDYWNKTGYYPFIIRVAGKLAGFAFVNKRGSTPDVDWYLAEFFIAAKYQRKGIGRHIAIQIFDKFQGQWEVMQIPANKAAIHFWQNVINQYTNGHYTKTKKIIFEPENHEMIVLGFQAKK